MAKSAASLLPVEVFWRPCSLARAVASRGIERSEIADRILNVGKVEFETIEGDAEPARALSELKADVSIHIVGERG